MAGISVRRIDNDTYERLQKLAQKHGVSMEEEVRQILRSATHTPDQLGDLAIDLFGSNGVDIDLPQREVNEPVNLHQ